MDNRWRWSQVTDPRDRQINESCENFRSRTTIFSPGTQLECGHRQSHFQLWNWERSSSKNNSENCPNLCLISVRPNWDMFTLQHTIAVSIQKHLGSNEAGMGQSIVCRPLKIVHWLVLWVDKNKDYVIKSTLFKNGCTNLRLLIFTDSSEKAICIVAYLPDEARLRLTYVIGKCRVAPIRHSTIPKLELQAAAYRVRLRKQTLNKHDVKLDKNYHLTNSSALLQWLQAANKKQQEFVANRAAEILENSSMDQLGHVKGVTNPADIGTRGMSIKGLFESVWLNGPAWLQTDEEKWPKPWCQVNEAEAELVTSTVATETEIDNLFDWRWYSSFNRIRNFIGYC